MFALKFKVKNIPTDIRLSVFVSFEKIFAHWDSHNLNVSIHFDITWGIISKFIFYYLVILNELIHFYSPDIFIKPMMISRRIEIN